MSRTAKQLIDNLITAQEDYDHKNIGNARPEVCMKAFRERQRAQKLLLGYIIELEVKAEDFAPSESQDLVCPSCGSKNMECDNCADRFSTKELVTEEEYKEGEQRLAHRREGNSA